MARVIVPLLAQSDTGYIVTDLAGKAGSAVAAKYGADFEALYRRPAVFPRQSGRLEFRSKVRCA